MQPAVGSTIESTGTGCSTAAMTSERRADETQVVTGCARGPDKGSRLGLGTLGAAHSPDKTFPSRSGSGGRAPSRSGFFALYHPSEPSPAQPEQNLPRENPCPSSLPVLNLKFVGVTVQLCETQNAAKEHTLNNLNHNAQRCLPDSRTIRGSLVVLFCGGSSVSSSVLARSSAQLTDACPQAILLTSRTGCASGTQEIGGLLLDKLRVVLRVRASRRAAIARGKAPRRRRRSARVHLPPLRARQGGLHRLAHGTGRLVAWLHARQGTIAAPIAR
jgi:hypothetical protein